MDTAANKQLQYTNVIILETDVELVNGGPLVKYGWQGTGYYLSYGTVRKITGAYRAGSVERLYDLTWFPYENEEDEAEKAAQLLSEEMENAVSLAVPLTADAGTGKTWYEAKA